MKKICFVTILGCLLCIIACVHCNYKGTRNPRFYGYASWYCPEPRNKLTASGEEFNETSFAAAHRSLPFNTRVLVTRLDSKKSIIVRINDRGPYKWRRIIDLTPAAAQELDMVEIGITRVCVEVLQEKPHKPVPDIP